MVSGKYKVMGYTVNELLQNPALYAQLTNLTDEANETCFIYEKRKVIMLGFEICDLLEIASLFHTTEAKVRQMVYSQQSLYDFAVELTWRKHSLNNKWCTSLQEFKDLWVDGDFMDYLRQGKDVIDVLDEPFCNCSHKTPASRSLEEHKVTVDKCIGPVSITFGKYEDEVSLRDKFDFATVEVPIIGLSHLSNKDKIEAVRPKKSLLDKKATERLLHSKGFKETGAKAKSVKCDSCILTGAGTLLYTFSWSF